VSDKPSMARLLDACHLLDVGLLWDPEKFPLGPTEEHRPVVMASLGIAMEQLRAREITPRVMPAMRHIHGEALNGDPHEIAKHAVTVLSYHAELLRGILEADVVEDAVSLITAAVSLLVSHLEQVPYARIRLATFHPDGTDGPCMTCGQEH